MYVNKFIDEIGKALLNLVHFLSYFEIWFDSSKENWIIRVTLVRLRKRRPSILLRSDFSCFRIFAPLALNRISVATRITLVTP